MSGFNAPLAKYFISPGNRQGSFPWRPIPLVSVAATITVMLGYDEGIVKVRRGVYDEERKVKSPIRRLDRSWGVRKRKLHLRMTYSQLWTTLLFWTFQ